MAADQSVPDPYAMAAVLHRCLHALDRMERDPSGDRLAVVADLMSHEVGLPGWSTFSEGAGPGLQLAVRHLLRPVTVPDHRFDRRLEPVVDGYGLHATSTTGPHLLRRRVESSALREIMVVGGYAPDAARWVLECYADRETPRLVTLLPTMYAVVQAALNFPQAMRSQPAERGRSAQSGRGVGRLSLVAVPTAVGYVVDPEAYRASDAE